MTTKNKKMAATKKLAAGKQRGRKLGQRQRSQNNHSRFMFTRSWNKSTQILVFHQKQWISWTHWLMISLIELHVKLLLWLNTIRSQPSHHVRFKLLADFSFQVNLLSMLYLKVPRLSPSTLPQNKLHQLIIQPGPFQGHPKWISLLLYTNFTFVNKHKNTQCKQHFYNFVFSFIFAVICQTTSASLHSLL